MFFKKFFGSADKSYLSALSQAGSVGLHMVSGIVVGAVAGHLLDKWLDTYPWCTAVFLIVGIVAGFKNVYVDTKRLLARQQEEDDARYAAPGTPKEDTASPPSSQGAAPKKRATEKQGSAENNARDSAPED